MLTDLKAMWAKLFQMVIELSLTIFLTIHLRDI